MTEFHFGRGDADSALSAESIGHHTKDFIPLKTPRNRGLKATQQPKRAKPEDVLKSFNTWAFKREQPDSTATLLAAIAKAMEADKPIPFVLYWGKGPRSRRAEPDAHCLNYLKSLVTRIEEQYSRGAELTLILTDTHAQLNGHAPESTDCYFNEIKIAAHARGFHTQRLSRLVADLPDAAQPTDRPEASFLATLTACASKWYRGSEPADVAAIKYYQMNLVERCAVEHAYPDAVFVTFNGSEMRSIFPVGMPIFYMYSLKKGFSVKPWFMPAEPQQAPVSHAALAGTAYASL